jgi:hypothetical protein
MSPGEETEVDVGMESSGIEKLSLSLCIILIVNKFALF